MRTTTSKNTLKCDFAIEIYMCSPETKGMQFGFFRNVDIKLSDKKAGSKLPPRTCLESFKSYTEQRSKVIRLLDMLVKLVTHITAIFRLFQIGCCKVLLESYCGIGCNETQYS